MKDTSCWRKGLDKVNGKKTSCFLGRSKKVTQRGGRNYQKVLLMGYGVWGMGYGGEAVCRKGLGAPQEQGGFTYHNCMCLTK